MRQRVVGNADKGYMRGVVCEVRPREGETALYDVVWDHDTTVVDKGYLAHGLQPELLAV